MTNSGSKDFRPLSADEEKRFIAEGAGSPSANRWLSAVISLFNPTAFLDMDDRRLRDTIIRSRYRHVLATYMSKVMADDAASVGSYGYGVEGSVDRMEPMTAYSADTLIRFAMDRHRSVGLMCSKRIGDPVGTMMQVINGDVHGDSYGMSMSGSLFDLRDYMIRHMAIPVATHPFSSLQEIVNAVCYGTHGNGRLDPSGIDHEIRDDRDYDNETRLAPLSGCMEYSGSDCNPMLMAKMLSLDMFSEVVSEPTGGDIETLVASMPHAETMSVSEAVGKAQRVIQEAGDIPTGRPRWALRRFSLADYRTMEEGLADGACHSRMAYLAVAAREDTSDPIWVENLRRRLDDGMPAPGTTYAEALRMDRNANAKAYESTDDDDDEEERVSLPLRPDMADARFLITMERRRQPDPTLLHDVLKAMLAPESMPIIPELMAVSGGAKPLSAATLMDSALADAAMTAYDLIRSLAAPAADEDNPDLSAESGPQTFKARLIPKQALDLFFTDLHQGIPYDFALQTLLSRSAVHGEEERDPGFQGMAVSSRPGTGKYHYCWLQPKQADAGTGTEPV